MKRNLQVRNSISTNGRVSTKNFAGMPHIVVSGVGHIVADSVMNDIYYTRDAVQSLADELSGPNVYINAPVGHPEYEGQYVSASHPLAIAANWVGAFAYNFRMEGDRLVSDLAISEDAAKRSELGKEVLSRIESGEDCDMSTGLWLEADMADGECYGADGEPYSWIAKNMTLDHTALLPHQEGAASSIEGVGLHANRSMRDGESVDLEVIDMRANASAAAMRLPMADKSVKWDSAAAVGRIREFTNSTDKPSSNYRKYFMYFDRSAVDDFDSYKLPFADIIDGKPVAVPAAISAVQGALSGARGTGVDIPDADKAKAQEIVDAYKSRMEDDDKATMNMFNRLKAMLFGNKTDSEYNSESEQVTNNGVDPMKEKILAALNAAKVKVDGLDDDALIQAYNELIAKPAAQPAVNAELVSVVNALKDELSSVKQQLAANADAEKAKLVYDVVELDVGIDEADAKALGVNALKNILAKHGKIAMNAGGRFKPNAEEFNCEIPE